ncbi:efflux RND transporter permease subunit [bacterium]|nr:efflux RND transporter permease subunit [bacterium]
MNAQSPQPRDMNLINRIIWWCLNNRLIVGIVFLLIIGWGILVAPFDWNIGGLHRDPVPVDAIPDIGENQQIVFTEWMGRSPQDIEDQITYPLTVSLLGIPGVKTIRSYSMFGFSTVYVIFKEKVDFYWSRSRVLEKLNSLPSGTLPEGVQPMLGPDATALGQIFWYTLEGQDEHGNPTGGWDLQELRSTQDWYVRYALQSADGVSEVASVGGFVKEYQIDVDPDAMRAYNVSIEDVVSAVRMSNREIGARTIEINKVEYLIRGIGFVKSLADIENSVIRATDNVPVLVKNVAHVSFGPALRRGALDKEGSEAVGGVVVVRFGENPLAAIQNVKKKIAEISPGLPQKTLPDGTVSQIKIVPFYDRTGLIHETLNTLNSALVEEILITVVVIVLMLMHLRSSLLISGLLPLAVLMSFIAMKKFGVDANIVALSGIAIAIGTMVDMGIVINENILRHLESASPDENKLDVVFRAASEVGSAVLTAVATTVVSFLPVFFMEGAEGKLFKPLAYTKTFALTASIIVALAIIPTFALAFFTWKIDSKLIRRFLLGVIAVVGLIAGITVTWWIGLVLVLIAVYHVIGDFAPDSVKKKMSWVSNGLAVAVVTVILTRHWIPLGMEKGIVRNVLFVALLVGSLMALTLLYQRSYKRLLGWSLEHKATVIFAPIVVICIGAVVWLGFNRIFGWLPPSLKKTEPVSFLIHEFPGLGKEFMPPLDEGSYLFMPTTMPHASIGEAQDILRKQDIGINGIPEVESAVGKLGRAETPLDPAPVSMIETVINYKPEYLFDKQGKQKLFRFNPDKTDHFRSENGTPVPAADGEPYTVQGQFIRDGNGNLIPDKHGKPFRLWRSPLDPQLNPGRTAWKGITRPDDIWEEILKAARVPGVTSAPKLQPIAARVVMLQSGMRAPMGVKIKGPDLATIEEVGLKIEQLLKEVPSVEPASVIADRIVGKPYLEIHIDREKLSRYGIMLGQVQDVIESAAGGKQITTTVEGRERYPVRVRYLRELRDTVEGLETILVPAPDGTQIPLGQLADITYVRGPQAIKSEDTFLIGYVLFDKKPGFAEVDAVEAAQEYLRYKIKSGEFSIPGGVSYAFAGSYENQIRSQKKLAVILPLALAIIFLILYMQLRRVSTTMLVFSGIFVSWAGGFILIWLYGQEWFLNIAVMGVNLRELFNIHQINLSVAIWVGFLALFGIATDDGVIMATYLEDVFRRKKPQSVKEIREAAIEAGSRRVRPCLMTTATTILALLPVLTSTGQGSDIMIPMAIPSFGGMIIESSSLLIVPVLYAGLRELPIMVKRRLGKPT